MSRATRLSAVIVAAALLNPVAALAQIEGPVELFDDTPAWCGDLLSPSPWPDGWRGDDCQGQVVADDDQGVAFACDALCTWDGLAISRGLTEGEGAIPAEEHDVFTLVIDDTDPDSIFDGSIRVWTFDADGACSDQVDTVVEVWRIAGDLVERVGVNDDTAEGRCSALDINVQAGAYEVRVTGYGGAEIPRYRYAVEVSTWTADDGSHRYAGYVPAGGDDLYRVRGGDGTLVCTTGLDGHCPGDTVLTARHGANVLFDDDGGDGLCSCLELLDDVVYEVTVGGYADGFVGRYVLEVIRVHGSNNEQPQCQGDCYRHIVNNDRDAKPARARVLQRLFR